MDFTKKMFQYIWEKKSESIFVIVLICLGIYIFKDYDYIVANRLYYLMPIVVVITTLLTWLQFIFYKSNKRKESALTYFPRPIELENIENEIDKVLQIWIGEYTLNSYEVKLMIGEEINKEEYTLIWKKLSYRMKVKIISEYKEVNSTFEITDTLEYNDKFNHLIDETYFEVRRKINLYLNQIEGYCLALNKGNIDKGVAYEMFSYKFPHFYDKVITYISMSRKKKGINDLYCEFEKIIHQWKNK